KGAYLSSKTKEGIKLINEFVDTIKMLDINAFACEEFGKEYVKLKNVGKIPDEIDLMIAAIVKANDLILITKNKKDFENINVKIEVW
ncbi:MAG: type II toxin-antitoxin system VapC family toxin, partial [Nanoarchaeota archaeon]